MIGADEDYVGYCRCYDRDVAFNVECDVGPVKSIWTDDTEISTTVKNTEYTSSRNSTDFPCCIRKGLSLPSYSFNFSQTQLTNAILASDPA